MRTERSIQKERTRILADASNLHDRSGGLLNLKQWHTGEVIILRACTRPHSKDNPKAVVSLLETLGETLPGNGKPIARSFCELGKYAAVYYPDNTYTIETKPIQSREILNPLEILIGYLRSITADVPNMSLQVELAELRALNGRQADAIAGQIQSIIQSQDEIHNSITAVKKALPRHRQRALMSTAQASPEEKIIIEAIKVGHEGTAYVRFLDQMSTVRPQWHQEWRQQNPSRDPNKKPTFELLYKDRYWKEKIQQHKSYIARKFDLETKRRKRTARPQAKN